MSKSVISPFCKHLTAKKSYFSELPPRTEEELVDGSNHCWCAKTQLALGPDRDVVGPQDCCEGRTCFEPIL